MLLSRGASGAQLLFGDGFGDIKTNCSLPAIRGGFIHGCRGNLVGRGQLVALYRAVQGEGHRY